MTFPESLIRHSTSTSLTDDIEGFMKLSDQGVNGFSWPPGKRRRKSRALLSLETVLKHGGIIHEWKHRPFLTEETRAVERGNG